MASVSSALQIASNAAALHSAQLAVKATTPPAQEPAFKIASSPAYPASTTNPQLANPATLELSFRDIDALSILLATQTTVVPTVRLASTTFL